MRLLPPIDGQEKPAAYESVKVREIVDRAVSHAWSIPEFQRGFVWKPMQVKDLIESLWQQFPVGTLLVWNSGKPAEAQKTADEPKPSLWVVDGQQRTTALAILSGRKPYWWNSAEDWNKVLKKYDVRFDVNTKEPPYFITASAAVKKVKGDRYLPIAKLLALDTTKESDQKALQTLAKEIKSQGLCDGMDAMEVYTRLERIRKIRDSEIVTITIDHELEDVVEIFSRLNSKGTRVTEADIYLGVVAARNPGWVRDVFLPYLKVLASVGFDLNPNLLFRSVTAVGVGKVRSRDIPDEFWNSEKIKPAWDDTSEAWKRLIARVREYGILSNNPLPTETALITLAVLIHRFKDEDNFDKAMYWFLQASRFGRYSGSAATAVEEDMRDINESETLKEAIKKLVLRFSDNEPITAGDFLRDYTDNRFWTFLLYLMVYRNEAIDWDEHGHRLGFEGAEALADFRPEWHHVFPRKYLEGKVDASLIDAVANIAVIGPSINIRISAKDPLSYVTKYNISDEKLKAQYISPDFVKVGHADYPAWLEGRATALADASNAFLKALRGDL